VDVTELRQLVDYHYWARDRLLVAVERLSPDDFTRDLGSSFHSVRDTLVHLYSAERIWCARWQEQPPRAAAQAGGFADVASLRTAWRDLEAEVRAVTERFVAAGIDRVVPYRDLKGHPWEGVFWQLLQHVVNHGSYHRGQVTTMLRQLQAGPAESMDLITFYRLQSR
jgi:uncharacterized damage-inducible protein DinB